MEEKTQTASISILSIFLTFVQMYIFKTFINNLLAQTLEFLYVCQKISEKYFLFFDKFGEMDFVGFYSKSKVNTCFHMAFTQTFSGMECPFQRTHSNYSMKEIHLS